MPTHDSASERSLQREDASVSADRLEHAHDPSSIHSRLAAPVRKSYLRDAVYGAIDGAVTTFAVVAGVSGAGLEPSIVIILGIANLIGDGFSMAAANFLGIRAELQQVERITAIERKHIDVAPEGERAEVRQILINEGYSGELLDLAVAHITSNRENWVKFMLQHEYGIAQSAAAPLPAASVTFASFIVIGFIPLLPFVTQWIGDSPENPFPISTLMTGVAFFAVGGIKSRYVEQHWLWSALETLAIGGIAAALAYAAGYALGGLGS